MNILLRELVKSTKGKFIFGNPLQQIMGVSTDTRAPCKGMAFFALKGKNYDGYEFIKKAAEKGAAVLIISKLGNELDEFFPNIPGVIVVGDTLQALGDFAGYYRSKFPVITIGITGSNGKSTTKEMLASILSIEKPTLANFGSYNNLVGVPSTLFELNKEHQYCVLELGISVPGEIDRLIEITSPKICVITNIGSTHLEYLKTINGVFEEKRKSVDSLAKDEIAVLNIDDEYLNKLSGELSCKVITYGLNPTADVHPTDISMKETGLKFTLHSPAGTISLELPVYGRFNIYNALAASASAHALGVSLETIQKGLLQFKQLHMRMEIIKTPEGAIIVNDAYNANPSSMREALENFVQMYPDRQKIAVLGDMLELGDSAKEEHALLGEFTARLPLFKIYLYGKKVKYFIVPSLTETIYFEDQAALTVKLKSELNDSVAVLFKGSRALELEKIVERLIV